MSSDPRFEVVCTAGKFADRWVVVRVRDRKVMTEGAVTTCLAWVAVWGPVRA